MSLPKTIQLKEGVVSPTLGFGTWRLAGVECKNLVLKALEVGYRHIDTADRYQNHKEVGQAIKESRIPRKEIFVTTKIWLDQLSAKGVESGGHRFLKELSLDYIDLLLIHWPNRGIPIKETLAAMTRLKEKGLVKSLGVSNFTVNHLKDALKTGYPFSVNQVEFHPTFNQKGLKAFCDQNQIVITAYSPLGQGEDVNLPEIQNVAEKYSRTPAQAILNWVIKRGMIAIPKSSKEERIKDNFLCLEWELTEEDIRLIDKLDKGNRQLKPEFADFDY